MRDSENLSSCIFYAAYREILEDSHFTIGHLKMTQLCLCTNAPVAEKRTISSDFCFKLG